MTSKHIGPLCGSAWRAAWKRIWRSRKKLEQLQQGLGAVFRSPTPLSGQLKSGDPEAPLPPEFHASLDEELAMRGLSVGGCGRSVDDADRVLARAALRVARYLQLSDGALQGLLSPQLVALARGERADTQALTPEQREGALCLIRIHQELDAIVPYEHEAIQWLHGPNTALGDSPLALLEEGRMDDVLRYLEQARHR